MTSDAPSPKRPPRRTLVRPKYSPPYRVVWWLGALLPSICIGLELVGVLQPAAVPWITPVNLLITSLIVCSAASYSQRRDVEAMLIDFAMVLLVVLAQITLIGGLGYYLLDASPENGL